MQGITTFASLEQARLAGFEVYDRINDGYLVRKKMRAGCALAIVNPDV